MQHRVWRHILIFSLAGASITLCLVFPKFVSSVKNQGATFEVMERLHFFAEMNQIRTVFRCIYAIAFVSLLAIAPPETEIWVLNLIVDHFCRCFHKQEDGQQEWILVRHAVPLRHACSARSVESFGPNYIPLTECPASTCISVVVLLPRNMNAESLPVKPDEHMHPMVAYKRPLPPTADGYSPRQFYELGDRLNIDRDSIGAALRSPGFEMKHSPMFRKDVEDTSDQDVPFAMAADRTRRARFSEMPTLPGVVAKFKSPFETAAGEVREPTRVYVTTSQTVRTD